MLKGSDLDKKFQRQSINGGLEKSAHVLVKKLTAIEVNAVLVPVLIIYL